MEVQQKMIYHLWDVKEMWSKTKKQLNELLCNSLKDRVDVFCSNYRMHDGIGRTYITVDGNEVYNMCTLKRDFILSTCR